MEGTVGVLKFTISNLQANKSKDPTASLIGSNGAATLGSAFLVNYNSSQVVKLIAFSLVWFNAT